MKEKQDYIRDIAEMRSMMERSSKFLSLSGLAGVLAGIYALGGAYVAHQVLNFKPGINTYTAMDTSHWRSPLSQVILLALLVLVLAVGTAILLSWRKAVKRNEKFYNATTKRVMINMAVPLMAGGLFILMLLERGLVELLAPSSLLFYGLALYNVGKFTYDEVKSLGIIQIALGLISAYMVTYGVLFWAIGFGLVHIIYGIYIHYKYER
jgi:Predicted ABC-type transport system involved in lysophospholipase L1 biosynthesis, permease component